MSVHSPWSVKDNFRSLFHRPAKHLSFLDGLRAISILWVMLFHIHWFVGIFVGEVAYRDFLQKVRIPAVMEGVLGVDIFFVLSGFLISSQVFIEARQSKTVDLKNFYVKRAFRIFPAYFLVLSFLFFAIPQYCNNVWANFFYVNNYIPMTQSCMGWSWSLAIEEQFYLLFPLSVILLWKVSGRLTILLAVLAGAFLLNIFIFNTLEIPFPVPSNPAFGVESYAERTLHFYSPTHVRFGSLLMGVIVGYLSVERSSKMNVLFQLRWLDLSVLFVSFMLIGLTVAFPAEHMTENHFGFRLYYSLYHYLFSLGVACLILSLLYSSHPFVTRIKRLLSAQVLFPIAQLSYSLYIIHPLVIMIIYFINRDSLTHSHALTIIPVLALCFLGAGMLFVFVERPFIKMRRHFLKSRKKSEPATETKPSF